MYVYPSQLVKRIEFQNPPKRKVSHFLSLPFINAEADVFLALGSFLINKGAVNHGIRPIADIGQYSHSIFAF